MKGREGCFAYLDIKIIGGQDELEESPLIHLNNSIVFKKNLFLALQDSSITDIVCLSLGRSVGRSQLTITTVTLQ